MESTSFLESWKAYTIRDKILFGSFILPFFISIIHLLVYLPLDYHSRDGGLGELLFSKLFSDDKIFNNISCENYTWEDYGAATQINSVCAITFVYIINPLWLLLSSISLTIYGFFLFKTNEETSKLLNREIEDKSGLSALARLNAFVTANAGAQIFILFSLIAMYYEIFRAPSEWVFFHGVHGLNLFEGTTFNNPEPYEGINASINPFSYLYFPHLIATVVLAYYSRNKNIEENIDFIEQSEAMREARLKARLKKEKEEKEAKEAAILQDKIDRAKHHEKLLEFYEAEQIYKELKMDDELIRIRKLKSEQGSVKVTQKVVHGDEITKTEIKDSVVSKSNIGSGGDDKLTKIKELKELHDAGAIDDNEFKKMKKEILGE